MRRQSRLSNQELSVSCASIESRASREENRARNASSITAISTPGRGSCICDKPSTEISTPSPVSTETTTTDSTSAKLEKRTPAANQKCPRFGGKVELKERNAPIGSRAKLESSFIADTSGKSGTSSGNAGSVRPRLTPMPPPSPFTKNGGGPPRGMRKAAKPNNEV